jgi:hypothetical protein
MKGKAVDTSRNFPGGSGIVVRFRLPDAATVDRLFEVGTTAKGGSSLLRRKYKAGDPPGAAPSEDWWVVSMPLGREVTD